MNHPTTEQLVNAILFAKAGSHDQVISHVATCQICKIEMEELEQQFSDLKNAIQFSSNDVVSHLHLSDIQINDYVYDISDPNQRKVIEKHLDQCEKCKLQVLRLRTHLAQKSLDSQVFDKQAANDASSTPYLLSDSKTEPVKRKSIFNSYVIGYGIAASLLLLIAGLLLPQYTALQNSESSLIISEKNEIELDKTEFAKAEIVSNDLHPVHLGNGLQKVSNGVINWYDDYVETEAIGTVDMRKMANQVQAEVVAEKTARHIAYSQLAEILSGVRVTQHASYKDLLLDADNLTVENVRFIQGAEVVKKSLEWVMGSPKATVIMRLPLHGNGSVRSIIDESNKFKIEQLKTEAFVTTAQTIKSEGNYSGILLDVRETGFVPSVLVELVQQKMDSTLIATNRKDASYYDVKYFSSLQNANLQSAVGDNPYIIKAVKTSKQGIIVIDESESEKVKNLLGSVLQPGQNNLAVLL